MAYTLPNTGIIRPWNVSRNRYIHRRSYLTVGGANVGHGGGATGTAQDIVDIPCPGRLVSYSFGLLGANGVAANGITGGTLVLKAETTAGVQILSNATMSTEVLVPTPLGTTSIDEGRAATAATDGISGGFPVRRGVYLSMTGGTDTEVVVVDLWFKLCTWVKLSLSSQTGADGSGAVNRTVRLGNAGVLAAIAMDFTSMPVTTDVTINADDANGALLFTSTDSATDLAPSLLGSPGFDEAKNVTAATDGTEAGSAFRSGLYFAVAQADAFTTGDEAILVECWIDD